MGRQSLSALGRADVDAAGGHVPVDQFGAEGLQLLAARRAKLEALRADGRRDHRHAGRGGLDGDRGSSIFAAGFPTSVSIPCPSWTPHSVPAGGAGTRGCYWRPDT